MATAIVRNILKGKTNLFLYGSYAYCKKCDKAAICNFNFTIDFSCKAYNTFDTSIELNRHFTVEQIGDLNRIIDFFKSEICLNQDDDFKTCYQRIPLNFRETSNNSFWTLINFKKQENLYEQISESTFKEIWRFCESTYFPSQTKAQDICAVMNGKYQKYLSELARLNPRIAEYLMRIQASGDFGSFDIRYEQVLKDKKHFDLDDRNIQLILAIHYLSSNDQFKRNAHLKKSKRLKY